MLEVTKCAPQMAIIQLGEAFKNFWAGRAKFPTFCKKGVRNRFTLTNDQFDIDGCRMSKSDGTAGFSLQCVLSLAAIFDSLGARVGFSLEERNRYG